MDPEGASKRSLVPHSDGFAYVNGFAGLALFFSVLISDAATLLSKQVPLPLVVANSMSANVFLLLVWLSAIFVTVYGQSLPVYVAQGLHDRESDDPTLFSRWCIVIFAPLFSAYETLISAMFVCASAYRIHSKGRAHLVG